jgi:hypothetical protein
VSPLAEPSYPWRFVIGLGESVSEGEADLSLFFPPGTPRDAADWVADRLVASGGPVPVKSSANPSDTHELVTVRRADLVLAYDIFNSVEISPGARRDLRDNACARIRAAIDSATTESFDPDRGWGIWPKSDL